MLADIVSKNGNLMLNIPVRGDGTIDDLEIGVLEKIAAWMEVNHEAIFATRPWRVYGEGPSTTATLEKGSFDGIKDTGKFSSDDVRFTRSKDGKTVYALILGWPGDGATITLKSLTAADHVHAATLLGSHAKLVWKESPAGVSITLPKGQPSEAAVVVKLSVQPSA
jgi:alpha-L-fucosidase